MSLPSHAQFSNEKRFYTLARSSFTRFLLKGKLFARGTFHGRFTYPKLQGHSRFQISFQRTFQRNCASYRLETEGLTVRIKLLDIGLKAALKKGRILSLQQRTK